MNVDQNNEIKIRPFCRLCSKIRHLFEIKNLFPGWQYTFLKHHHKFTAQNDTSTLGKICIICVDDLKFALKFYKKYDESFNLLKSLALRKSNAVFESYCCFCMSIKPNELFFVSHIKKMRADASGSLFDCFGVLNEIKEKMKMCRDCIVNIERIIRFHKVCPASKRRIAISKNQTDVRQTATDQTINKDNAKYTSTFKERLANNNAIQYPTNSNNSTQADSEVEDFEDLIPFSSAVRQTHTATSKNQLSTQAVPIIAKFSSAVSQKKTEPAVQVRPKYLSNLCGLCNKIFPSSKLLEKHPCNYYDEPSNLSSVPPIHQRIRGNKIRPLKKKGFYPCYICSENFETLFGLNQHLDLHYAYIYKCERCSKQFEIGLDLELHLYHTHEATVDNDRSFFAFFSSYFIQKSLEKFTYQENAIKNKYQCIECNKFFDTPAQVADHAELLYRCSLCFAKFKTKNEVERHKTTKHTSKNQTVLLNESRLVTVTREEDSSCSSTSSSSLNQNARNLSPTPSCSSTLTSSSIDLQIKEEFPVTYQTIPDTGDKMKLIKSYQLSDSIKNVTVETMNDRSTYKCEVCDQEFHCTDLLQQHTCLELTPNTLEAPKRRGKYKKKEKKYKLPIKMKKCADPTKV